MGTSVTSYEVTDLPSQDTYRALTREFIVGGLATCQRMLEWNFRCAQPEAFPWQRDAVTRASPFHISRAIGLHLQFSQYIAHKRMGCYTASKSQARQQCLIPSDLTDVQSIPDFKTINLFAREQEREIETRLVGKEVCSNGYVRPPLVKIRAEQK